MTSSMETSSSKTTMEMTNLKIPKACAQREKGGMNECMKGRREGRRETETYHWDLVVTLTPCVCVERKRRMDGE